MKMTTRSISVSELKARLSEQLRRVKAGETVLITERGRPIGLMTPLPQESTSDDLADLVEAGLIRPPMRRLDADFWQEECPPDPEASVRRALIDERREGR